MCGIAGILGPEADADRLRRMQDLLVHRGPDSAGELCAPGVALGVRRLRIIDLVTGDQPISNEDGTVSTVYNGEIYNFPELRSELAARGHRFATRTDTEVIVHLYEDHGDAFVDRIDGMFALAVWDARRRRLVLARDRLGKKPLLYATTGGGIVFASEHRALLAGLGHVPSPDPRALGAFLRLGYVPSPDDAFSGVRKLPPGHLLTYADGHAVVRRYWGPPREGLLRIDRDEAAERLGDLVRRAVRRRLVSDVPLGAFLSGGIDSSIVVGVMAGLADRVRTFAIGFEDPELSELEHARVAARAFGTEHHEEVVGAPDPAAVRTLVRHYGEPYADSSAIPTYYLSRLARRHVTVALNGDGGDELFAGYDRYRALRLASVLDRVAGPAAPALVRAGAAVLGPLRPRAGQRARRFAAGLGLARDERYAYWAHVIPDGAMCRLLRPDAARAMTWSEPAAAADGDPVAAAQRRDLLLYLPDDLLVKVDIASMAHSLEVRSPFLDRDVVEFASRLPVGLKLRGLESKFVLKRAFRDLLPPAIRRRRKQGFGVPIDAWLRGPLRELMTDALLGSARSRGILEPTEVESTVGEHLSGRADHGHRLWTLLMLELWHQELVDRPAA